MPQPRLNGVLQRKLAVLDATVAELRSLGDVTTHQVRANWMLRRAIERNLQIAVEVLIDVCQRLLTTRGETPADTAGTAISRCVTAGILSAAAPYAAMVRFRNFIVHRYEDIDVEVLVGIVRKQLTAFVQFRDEINAYVARVNDL